MMAHLYKWDDIQTTKSQYINTKKKTHVSAPRRPNENPVEGAIRDIKKRWYRIQTNLHIPDQLWDYGINYVCETGNLTVKS